MKEEEEAEKSTGRKNNCNEVRKKENKVKIKEMWQ